MNTIRRVSNYILLMILALTLSTSADAAEMAEYEIKSGMIYNFTLFVDWPSTSSANTASINVCVAGDRSAMRYFNKLEGKLSKNRPIKVRQISGPGSISGCDLLFLQGPNNNLLSGYLQAAQKRPVLTVSDIDNFASKGGIIGFYEQKGKVRFEINLDAARQSKFRINSQLLKLARIVTGR